MLSTFTYPLYLAGESKAKKIDSSQAQPGEPMGLASHWPPFFQGGSVGATHGSPKPLNTIGSQAYPRPVERIGWPLYLVLILPQIALIYCNKDRYRENFPGLTD